MAEDKPKESLAAEFTRKKGVEPSSGEEIQKYWAERDQTKPKNFKKEEVTKKPEWTR